MTKYWSITPWPSDEPRAFEEVWRYDLSHGVISIGGDEVGDPAGISRAELHRRFLTYCADWPGGEHQVWNLYNEVQIGDILFVRRGLGQCIAIGRVKGSARFDRAQGIRRMNGSAPEREARSNFVSVTWMTTKTVPVRHPFHRKTLNEIKNPALYPELIAQIS